jgi:hypothetical protein
MFPQLGIVGLDKAADAIEVTAFIIIISMGCFHLIFLKRKF